MMKNLISKKYEGYWLNTEIYQSPKNKPGVDRATAYMERLRDSQPNIIAECHMLTKYQISKYVETTQTGKVDLSIHGFYG